MLSSSGSSYTVAEHAVSVQWPVVRQHHIQQSTVYRTILSLAGSMESHFIMHKLFVFLNAILFPQWSYWIIRPINLTTAKCRRTPLRTAGYGIGLINIFWNPTLFLPFLYAPFVHFYYLLHKESEWNAVQRGRGGRGILHFEAHVLDHGRARRSIILTSVVSHGDRMGVFTAATQRQAQGYWH